MLAQWNEIGRKLIAMAEDFPEDKYEFKPVPEQRTFAAQLLHVSASMYYFTDPAEGKKPRYPDDPKRDDLKTKAQVVAFVKKCVADGAAEIKAKGDKGMSELVTDPESKQQTPVADLAYGLIEHSGEHYGQLVVYYRCGRVGTPGIAAEEVANGSSLMFDLSFQGSESSFRSQTRGGGRAVFEERGKVLRVAGGREAGLAGADRGDGFFGWKMRKRLL